jgi:hypothetical protein
MLSQHKNMPGVAWLVIGVSVTALVMPTAAFAAGITWSGIEGQNKNKADVTAAGQLETSPADVNSAFHSQPFGFFSNSNMVNEYTPPSGDAAVITSIHVDMGGVPASGALVDVDTGTSNGGFAAPCSASANVDQVDTATDGITILPYSPGYVLPAGQSLCAIVSSAEAIVSAEGYLIPAADAPAAPQTPAGSASTSIKPPVLQG